MTSRAYKLPSASSPFPLHSPADRAARPTKFIAGAPQYSRRLSSIPTRWEALISYLQSFLSSPFLAHAPDASFDFIPQQNGEPELDRSSPPPASSPAAPRCSSRRLSASPTTHPSSPRRSAPRPRLLCHGEPPEAPPVSTTWPRSHRRRWNPSLTVSSPSSPLWTVRSRSIGP
jgi:hypothetical protein